MRRFALAALLLAACNSEPAERQSPEPPPPLAFDGAAVTEASARLAHGERLTWVLGCRGCHGKDLQGKDFYGVPSANLTRDIHRLSDAQFIRALREGERADQRDMWAMPSEIFQHLGDPDMAALIAHLRTLKPAGEPTPPLPPLPADVRKEIAEGTIKPAAQWVRETKDKTPVDLGEAHAQARYIAMVTCAECHGPELKGHPGDTPDLIVVGAYSRDEFEKLITQGIPPGGRKLKNELMANVAQRRFSRLTPNERDRLYAYLKARAELPQ